RRHTRFSRDWSSDVCSSDLWEPSWLKPLPPGDSVLLGLHRLGRQTQAAQAALDTLEVLDQVRAARHGHAHGQHVDHHQVGDARGQDRKSTRLNSSHVKISYAVFCLKKKNSKT